MKNKIITKNQLTKREAIVIYDSGIWREWTDDEIVAVQLFEECLVLPFEHFQNAMSRVLGRPVFTHEFADKNSLKKEYLRVKGRL